MNLEMMRLSLWPRKDVSARVAYAPDGQPIEREAWLRETFGRSIVFSYRGHRFHFVPITDEIDAPFMGGRIGLLGRVRENLDPAHGLEDVTRDRWKAIVVLMDPRSHRDGQKVAVEFGTGVAKPFPIFSALVYHINKQEPPPPYAVEVKQIDDKGSFWDFVKRNEGEVTSVTFELLATNMFGIEDDMDKEMAELKRHEKAKRAELTIENEDGLNLHTKRVEQAVKYTERGGGDIRAKAKHDTFSSTRAAKRVRVPDEPIGDATQPASIRSRFARALRYVFNND